MMKLKKALAVTTSAIMLASLCALSVSAAAPKRPQKLTVVPKAPAYLYMPETEKNAALFDESKMLTQAVLINVENKSRLSVIDVEEGVTRDETGGRQNPATIEKNQAALDKRIADNKKNNPFSEYSDSFVRFPTVKAETGIYNIAATASNASDLVIYTLPNGSKWNVKKGQILNIKLILDQSMYKVGRIPAQKIEVGYIQNNKLFPLTTSDAATGSLRLKLPVTGVVEFYTMNVTLDRQILANGSIQVSESQQENPLLEATASAAKITLAYRGNYETKTIELVDEEQISAVLNYISELKKSDYYGPPQTTTGVDVSVIEDGSTHKYSFASNGLIKDLENSDRKAWYETETGAYEYLEALVLA